MKISPKKYAIALFLSLRGKSPQEAKLIIANFIKLLDSHNRLGSVRKVIFYLESLYQKEGLSIETTVLSAHQLSADLKQQIKNYLQTKSPGAVLDWKEEVDPRLYGGFILRFGDKILDASLKSRLSAWRQYLKIK